MHGQKVLRFSHGGGFDVVCDVPARPSGLAWTGQGDLLISSMADQLILRLRAGTLEPFADLTEAVPGDLNDMISDRRGGLYIGNFGFRAGEAMKPTVLVHVNGSGETRCVAEGLGFPNGMAITPDGRNLLVAETFSFRISAFEIRPDGSLSTRRDWAAFSPAPVELDPAAAMKGDVPLPDGICLDAEGALWIADAGGDGVIRVAPGGKILDRILTPGLSVFAVELGGRARKTLYMCAAPKMGTVDFETERAGRLLACEISVPGV
ncbi:SMP-30/gluconolactonase/LRE family protein [Pseudarthrobacter sp. R1]|nr:SMP-30/gluconolactonase/LRE family protein [Pseudarthrobacter sp. R1]